MKVTILTETYQTFEVDPEALAVAYGDCDLASYEVVANIVEGELEDQGERFVVPWLTEVTDAARAERSVFEVDMDGAR